MSQKHSLPDRPAAPAGRGGRPVFDLSGTVQRIRPAALRLMLVSAVAGTAVFSAGAPVKADAIWNRWQAADQAVAQGQPAKAVPHWTFLTDHYAALGDWQNAALFAGRLDEYFDKAGDYEQAIRYYELENQYWLKAGKDWGAVDLQRAEQIRTTVEAYIRISDPEALKRQAAPASGKLEKFEPAYGSYIGMYTERDPQMLNYFDRSEQFYNKKHALYLAYAPVTAAFPEQYAERAKQAGAALQIGWEPGGGLDTVTESVVRSWAKGAKEAGIPIFLRYASEMNGPWVAWHGDPKKYIEKFRMVHDIMAQEAPNVAMVWSPGEVPMYSMDTYYPGDAYVDWVGVSTYNEPYENGDPKQGNMQATSPIERLDYLYKTYAARKPLMISETAVSHYANIPQESFTDYGLLNLQRVYDILPAKYPRLKSITYFNVNLELTESKNNYLLRDNDAMMKLYTRLIAPQRFLSKVENAAVPADRTGYVPLSADVPFTQGTRIVPFVKIPEVYIGKVEYALNGQLLDTQTAPPFAIELAAGSVPEGSVLKIAVYNRDGVKRAEKSFGITSGVAVKVDGKELAFEQPPVIRDGSTLTPLRAIFESMGAEVSWDAATKTATAVKGGTKVSIAIGSSTARRNSEMFSLEVPAQLVGGYTMVPARFVSEAFGAEVKWDGGTRTVDIRTSAGALSAKTEAAEQQVLAYEEYAPADQPAASESKPSGWYVWLKRQASRLADLIGGWI
ncbi:MULTISPECIES: stalk domain-containing protein [Paenibacillus]|uniref:stalk domain-containing protein n=1 Tax=Paenibacillus TaxID=44249 RepID=UPI0022B88536|nr:stalk domain-containing protein [Paenibacillus caseinilyticus]MCZ8518710.1 stalk domain-containing protein [Paenibacillus caseinilyticus]